MEPNMREIEKIRDNYAVQRPTKIDELKALDKKAALPARIFAYVFGGAGTLVLGVGMCLAMKVIGDLFALGIAVGVAGIAMVGITYPLYKAVLKSRKKKYAGKIFELCDTLLNK